MPNTVISRITGVPPGDDEVRFRRIAQSVIAGFMPFTPPDLRAEAERSFQELSSWVRELVRKRRAHPEEDLVSDLVHAQDADGALTEDDVVLLLAGLIGAGSETTSQGGASIVRMLLAEPAAMERLRADRALIRRAIDEIIRFTLSGPGGTVRFALRDFELRGKPIRKGQMLMLSIGGANRDPAVFENPDVLDLDRPVRDLARSATAPTTASAPTSRARRWPACSTRCSTWCRRDRGCARTASSSRSSACSAARRTCPSRSGRAPLKLRRALARRSCAGRAGRSKANAPSRAASC